MVEHHLLLPALFIVAIIAFLALLARVRVLLPVTGIAVGLGLVLVQIARVAADAFDFFVFAQQLEIGLVVIEFGLGPVLTLVAILTLLAIQTFVRIDELMAEIAIALQLAFFIRLLVALIADYRLVLAVERKFGVLVMIELGG